MRPAMNAPKGGETILAEALCLPPEQRAIYVAQATLGNPDLRQEVESLLQNYAAGEFLEQAASAELRPTLGSAAPPSEKAGDTIGRYKLLQQIGEGGCGVVYMAEQFEPVRRRVALKIIKLGMDTKSVIARFEAERQALALMDHPNIAKVFDAGATETGRPYFVMELVRGLKITDYCDEKKLSTRDRLDLFLHACHAIQHAHQKGIIHRDIKPSNILVSVDDGSPVLKIIDFGIAKATNGLQLTNRTLFTAFEQFIGTPAYMSPEQAVVTNVDVDTRSDIYSLGVLLYELLTGKTPFDPQELLAIGLDEMRRTISEREPPRPSTRLSTLSGQELSTTAQRRGLEAPKLVSELRGDLDWIIMKALEKDRSRRYETANGLAADVRRHLQNEPVVACPPSNLYRLQKVVRRNQLAFAAAAAVIIALLAGVIVSVWQANRAWRAEQAARSDRDSTEAVLTFFQEKVLAAGRPEGLDGGLGKDVTLRKVIDATELEITKTFQDRPLLEAAIRYTLSESYRYLGETSLAREQAERALALRRHHLGLEHTNTLKSMNMLAIAFVHAGKPEQAIPLLEQALELWKTTAGIKHPERLRSMAMLGMAYSDVGKNDVSLPIFQQVFRIRKETLGADNIDTLNAMSFLANAYGLAGKTNEALSLREEVFRLSAAKMGTNDPTTLYAKRNLAAVYIDVGKAEEAVSMLNELLEIFKSRFGPDHPDTITVMANLASAHHRMRKLGETLELFDEVYNLRKQKLGPDHPHTLYSMTTLGVEYRNAGNHEKALPLLEEALTLHLAKRAPDHPETLHSKSQLALAFWCAKKPERAIPLFVETLQQERAKLGTNHPSFVFTLHNLAIVYRDVGKLDQALELMKEEFEVQKARLGADDIETLRAMGSLATAYDYTGNLGQALPLFEETIKRMRPQVAPDDRHLLVTTFNLALAYKRTGKLEEALSRFEEALKVLRAGRHDDILKSTIFNLASIYQDTGKPEKAVQLWDEAFETRKEKHGADHPDTLEAMGMLALAHQTSGNLARALSLMEEVCRRMEAKVEPDDSRLLIIMYNLAVIYRQSDKPEEARSLFEKTLKLLNEKRPPDDELAKRTVLNLFLVHLDIGQPDKALQVWEDALKVRKDKLGANHPDTLKAMEGVAISHYRIGKINRAHALYEETHETMKTILGAHHIDTLFALQNRGAFYHDTGEFERAISLWEEALKLSEVNPGPNDPQTIELLGLLGQAFLSLKNYPEAEARIRDLTGRIKQPNRIPSEIATKPMVSLGRCFLDLEEWAKAEPVLRNFLTISQEIQPDGVDTDTLKSMLGAALLGQGKIGEAEPLVVGGYFGLKKKIETPGKLDNEIKEDYKNARRGLGILHESWDGPRPAPWTEEAERVRRKSDPGAIRRWLILAPIPLDIDQTYRSALETEHLAGEPALRPRPGDKTSSASRELVWRECSLQDYPVDFNHFLGEITRRSVAYAVCYVRVPTARKGLLLKVGSDDQARVYLNGQKIYENFRDRALLPDENTVSDIELKAGLNLVVFKIVNGVGGWGGSLRFADKDDQPIPDLEVTLQP